MEEAGQAVLGSSQEEKCRRNERLTLEEYIMMHASEGCSFCGKVGPSSKCSRCKVALYCNVECQRGHWKIHRDQCQSIPVFDLKDGPAFAQYISRRGFALIRWRGLTALHVAAMGWARRFFVLPFESKRVHGAGPDVGQQHGFMDLTWTEVFECKDHYDPRFSWPHPDFRKACTELASSLRAAALMALEILCREAKIDWGEVLSKLDHSPKQDLRTASNSALRILLYSKPSDSAITSHVFGTGNHTDNSFLTVAPCASVKGLEILPFDAQDKWINVEEEMRGPDVVCVFVGDSLNKISCGHYPSVIHRPNEQACLRPLMTLPANASDSARCAVARISTPYFLRGRQDSILGPARSEEVTVAQLERNHEHCRELWPWKAGANQNYYSLQKFTKAE
jgi:isopenicillin N synthase-like dioxygenase